MHTIVRAHIDNSPNDGFVLFCLFGSHSESNVRDDAWWNWKSAVALVDSIPTWQDSSCLNFDYDDGRLSLKGGYPCQRQSLSAAADIVGRPLNRCRHVSFANHTHSVRPFSSICRDRIISISLENVQHLWIEAMFGMFTQISRTWNVQLFEWHKNSNEISRISTDWCKCHPFVPNTLS